jgi:hypothetical protein
MTMRPRNADVKYPWELGRCQHWVPLGQAYQLTGDNRFAREVAHELDDFVEANPVGIGINWTCTMDVALRATSWAIALEQIRSSPVFGPDDGEAFCERAFSALFDHGVFIRNNLENTYEVTSNHFLSNLVGLWFVGAVFDDLPSGADWSAFARTSIEQEMVVQVLPDGADYESSIPYHRLVTELFLGAARLAGQSGQPLSAGCMLKLHQMVDYLAAVTRPDGLMPQVGDADDGRLHIFHGYGNTTPQDGRHIFGPASVMFGEPGWSQLAVDAGAWETTWWGLEPRSPNGTSTTPGPVSRLFPNAGVAVVRAPAGHHLLVTNGVVGTNGFGNHKHNDQLSFEYHHAGVPLIVDPGSYVYTSDADARNLFRSTASHNTVIVNGVEQNELRPDWLFRLFESSHAEHVSFVDDDERAEYVGRHHGYERLPQPVLHERTLRLQKASGTLEVVDRLSGHGTYDVRWHFHLAPGVSAAVADGTPSGRAGSALLLLKAGTREWNLQTPADLKVSVGPAWYSPSYGVKVPCFAIDLSSRVTLDGDRTYSFSIFA